MKTNRLSWYDHKIIVDRSIWRCGNFGKYQHGKLITKLLDNDGMMCCLGQDCLSCGIPQSYLKNVANPATIVILGGADISNKIPHLVEYGKIEITQFASDMIAINDSKNMTDSRRELELFLLAKKHRIFIQFVGEYN